MRSLNLYMIETNPKMVITSPVGTKGNRQGNLFPGTKPINSPSPIGAADGCANRVLVLDTIFKCHRKQLYW